MTFSASRVLSLHDKRAPFLGSDGATFKALLVVDAFVLCVILSLIASLTLLD